MVIPQSTLTCLFLSLLISWLASCVAETLWVLFLTLPKASEVMAIGDKPTSTTFINQHSP